MMTVAESASYFPDLHQRPREVLAIRVNTLPAACRDRLDSTRAAMVGGGDRG